MLGTYRAEPQFERLAKKRLGLRVFPFRVIDVRQVIHGTYRLRMFRTHYTPLNLQSLSVELLGLRVFALKVINDRQVVHGKQRIGMLGTQKAAPYLPALF